MTVADRVRTFVQRFVVLSDEQLDALALWVLHTWAFGAAVATPYLVLMSPVWQSGKTRVLEVLQLLVKDPMLEADVSAAVLFRSIEQICPTLLYDEVDALWGRDRESSETHRALLNAGNRKGGSVARCVPPNWEVKQFSVFCPKALAGLDNGRWPSTLLDRSIVIRLRRKAPHEQTERFYKRDAEPEAAEIREELRSWAEAALEGLTEARPAFPDEDLSDRACDAWEPLFAIADSVNAEWSRRAVQAAVQLYSSQQTMEDSVGVALLRDIRTVFEEGDADRLKSFELCGRLRSIVDARWAGWGGRGSVGLRENDVAWLLRPFEIKPHVIRFNNSQLAGSTARGYLRSDFEDAWERYLPDIAADEPLL